MAIEQLLADGGEEMVVAEQVGDASRPAVGDRLAARAAQVVQDSQRVAEGGEGALDGRAQFPLVLRSDPHRVQHPAGPAVQAHEGAALALVAGGVDVQGIAMGQGGAQGRGALPVQLLQRPQEAIAQRGHGTGREGDPLAGQVGADLLALAVAVIARQARQCWPGGASPASRRDPASGWGQARQCLRISRARSVPAARVTSTRVLLVCVSRARPQCGQWRASATKSTLGGAPSAHVTRAILSPIQPASRACSSSSVSRE